MTTRLADRRLRLHPRVALRPEPFGALAYHYDNRKLVFLKHPDVVEVVGTLDGDATVSEALSRCGIARDRRVHFERALGNLVDAQMLIAVDEAGEVDTPSEVDGAGAR